MKPNNIFIKPTYRPEDKLPDDAFFDMQQKLFLFLGVLVISLVILLVIGIFLI